jgi:hypothetical protein
MASDYSFLWTSVSKSKLDYIRSSRIGQKTTKQYEDQFMKPIPGTLQEGEMTPASAAWAIKKTGGSTVCTPMLPVNF